MSKEMTKNFEECRKKIYKLLEEYDVVVPQKVYLNYSVEEKYFSSGAGLKKDLDCLKKIICEYYPDYIKDYETIFKGNSQYFYNMLIARKTLWDEYSKWLFDILEKLENKTDISGYDKRQQRIYGYIS